MSQNNNNDTSIDQHTIQELKARYYDIIKIKNGNYLCGHCETEIPVLSVCPKCNQNIDWTNIKE